MGSEELRRHEILASAPRNTSGGASPPSIAPTPTQAVSKTLFGPLTALDPVDHHCVDVDALADNDDDLNQTLEDPGADNDDTKSECQLNQLLGKINHARRQCLEEQFNVHWWCNENRWLSGDGRVFDQTGCALDDIQADAIWW